MQGFHLFGLAIPPWFYAPVVYFIWVTFFLLVKKAFMQGLEKASRRTASKWDDILVDALNFPLTLLIFVSGAAVLERILRFDRADGIATYFLIALRATAIVAAVLFLDRLVRGMIREYAQRFEVLRSSSGIVQGVARALVIGMGLLMLLDNFGMSITPVLASLGIGSLAVALALQPTLENFFAGVQILTDRTVMVGQFIRLESGEEGYVEKIGWRSLWIRMLPNNMVIVPNKLVMNSRMLNYDYPQSEMALLIQVGVGYDSDLARVEKVTTEVAEDVLKNVPGGNSEFKPFIRYHTFGSSSIDFTVILRVKSFIDQYLVKHEFIKHLHERYREEGIVIPFPLRTLDVKPETIELFRSALRS